MVSIRRRRLLGLCSGIDPNMVEIPRSIENGTSVESQNQNIKQSSVHPLSTDVIDNQKQIQISEESPESASLSGSTSMKEDPEHSFPDKQIKYRKQYRRKRYKDQEHKIELKGVYFKNTKWQAAIKVDKKQIHLGTVETQEEAAKLYDRAAYICGRQPNFDLSMEEMHELSKYKWEEYLEMTRNSISNKKHQRRQQGAGRGKKLISNMEPGNSG